LFFRGLVDAEKAPSKAKKEKSAILRDRGSAGLRKEGTEKRVAPAMSIPQQSVEDQRVHEKKIPWERLSNGALEVGTTKKGVMHSVSPLPLEPRTRKKGKCRVRKKSFGGKKKKSPHGAKEARGIQTQRGRLNQGERRIVKKE